jgi:site-specific DNA-cytosine methylase
VTCRDALQHLPLEQLGRPVRLKRMDPKHPPCKPSDPGTTVRSGGGNGNAAPHLELRIPENHRPLKLDRPSKTIMAKRTQVDAQVLALDAPLRAANINLPPADPDAPHRTIVGAGGGHQFMLSAEPEARPPRAFDGAAKMLEWPWDRPSTTVTTREAGPPPGHHPESGSILSQPNAVVLSERAAGILQGFPEDWHFAGKTKRARWSQLGQAMPPQLAEAVAGAVRAVMERDGLESEREIAGALA